MANTVNYATRFEQQLRQKYAAELATAVLTTQNVNFIGAKTVRFPFISVTGYKDHGRNGGFNRGNVSNDWITKELGFDRDVEFFVDSMDVDESNYAVTAANVTNVFLTEEAIPETDKYRISKMYSEFTTLGGTVDNTAITNANVLEVFDKAMMAMTEAAVPKAGRQLFVTPAVNQAIKEAQGLSRSLSVQNNNGIIDRRVTQLDEVTIHEVPSDRMLSVYDFSTGAVPGVGALQINMILVHPTAVLAVDKHSYIRLWPEGTHTEGDGWLYQNRKYGDLWLLDNRIDGVYMNVAASGG